MKLIAPPNTISVSYAGENMMVAEDGTLEVNGTEAVRELCDAHGFVRATDRPAAPVEKPVVDKFTDMSRAEVIGYIKSKGLPVAPSTASDELRAIARTQYSPEERAVDEAAAKAAADANK